MSREFRPNISIVELEAGELPVFPANGESLETCVPMRNIRCVSVREIVEFILEYGVDSSCEAKIVLDSINNRIGFFANECECKKEEEKTRYDVSCEKCGIKISYMDALYKPIEFGKLESYCKECFYSKQKYITMQQYIDTCEERDMTPEEAMIVFEEVALANLNKYQTFHYDKFWELFENDGSFINSEKARLPIDGNGNLPDLPILQCPDVDTESYLKQKPDSRRYYIGQSGPYDATHQRVLLGNAHKTELAAIAYWNRWMRSIKWVNGEVDYGYRKNMRKVEEQ